MLRAEAVAPDTVPDAWFWLMPHMVAVWIYWEALWLLLKARRACPLGPRTGATG